MENLNILKKLFNLIRRLFMANNETLTTFDEIIDLTLEHEGGYVHDPSDLGGETNFGIAKRFYPDVDIKNLKTYLF